MWAYEPFVGATFYFDEKRTASFATTAYWELHGKKKDTDVKVGQLLTLQGGLGKSYLGGGLILGAAYYAQWKLTTDDLATFVLPGGDAIDLDARNKHKVFAFGPDVTLPVASKSKLFALVNIRYLWETGARLKTEGTRWSSPQPSRCRASGSSDLTCVETTAKSSRGVAAGDAGRARMKRLVPVLWLVVVGICVHQRSTDRRTFAGLRTANNTSGHHRRSADVMERRTLEDGDPRLRRESDEGGFA